MTSINDDKRQSEIQYTVDDIMTILQSLKGKTYLSEE